MEQRFLGNSGLSVSALTFGTMTLGGRDRFAKMGNLGVDDTVRILGILRDAGVSTLDTADIYSVGGAEEVLGQALKGQRDDFVLVTKAYQRMHAGPFGTGLSRRYLVAACEASLRRLQTDYLDLYLCHEPDTFVPVEETLRAYDDLVSAGKVRYIGCSNHAAWQVMKALAASDRILAPRYVTQQVNYSLVARDVEHDIVPLALDQRCGLMVWSPLQAGLLTGKFRRDSPKPEVARINDLGVPGTVDFDRLYRIVDVLDAIARERAATIAQVAINWVLHKPGVDTVILGARNETQLRDILKSADFRLTPEESARLDEVSALPEPYPQWHQHKFGIERNPRLPAQR
ncbi:MAG TPA: aldo/keto reductase [Vicinamibacterales bacterium]|jgi:aryl-alcohol dehydrogenase-like predicted oxidoreductase